MDDVYQASIAVALANSAIDNARRAAATSRSRRAVSGEEDTTMQNMANNSHLPSDTPQTPRANPIPGTAEFVRNDATYANSLAGAIVSGRSKAPATDLDLKHNDNAYYVVATLVTDRLLPKLSTNSSFYTLSPADIDFFSQMLPHSVRRAFVDALRYRLRRSSVETPLGRLSAQCQMLGLDREKNVLLDLGQGREMTVSFC